MSLLLDALNKADQERKRNEAAPGIDSNHGHIDNHNKHNISIVVLAGALTCFLILLAAIFWLGQRSATTSTTAAESPTTPNTLQPIHKNQPVATTQTATISAPEKNNAEQDVANLYAQNIQATEPLTSNTTESIAADVNSHAETLTSTVTASTPTSITQFANLPNLHDLPNQILGKIPSLNYTEHNFNNISGSVKINGEIRHVNDELAPGLVIDKILEDGMILHLDNYSFKMRALNSWVNM